MHIKKRILPTLTAGLLSGTGAVQAQNISDLVTEGGFEAAPEPTLTTTSVGEWHIVDHASNDANRLRNSPVHSGSKVCEFDFNWGNYSLVQSLGVTVESGKDYAVDLWHAKSDLHSKDTWATDPGFTVEIWTSPTVDGTYSLAHSSDPTPEEPDDPEGNPEDWDWIYASNPLGVFGNYTNTITAAELAPYVGEYIQFRIKKQSNPVRGDLQIDDVVFGPIVTEAVIQTSPSEVALTFGDASAVIAAEVAVSYLEGVVPANVSITAVSITGQSHAGAFSNTTSLPLTITGPDPTSELITIQFDNTVSPLIEGETAIGTVELVWNEVGSATNHTASLPISARFLEVHDGNTLAVFDHAFENADHVLAGIEASITAGNRSNTQGSNDGTYGNLSGLTPAANAGKIGNGDVPVFVVEITNNTGADATFDSLNFDAGAMWPGAPESMDITITGDLTNGSIFYHDSFSIFNGGSGDYDDFDVDLTGLAKNTLADGESAAFTFSFAATLPENEFISLIVDNIAFIGSGTAAAILTREGGPSGSDWVNLPVTGGVSNFSQAIPMSYSEGDSASSISITNITFSDESHAVGAFGHDATFPIVLSTPETISNAFNLTFDNSLANLAAGESAEATVTVEWNEGGSSTRTLVFDAYASRPAIATSGVVAQFDRELLTPDAAMNGVLGWMGGGEGLEYDQEGSKDGNYGTLIAPAAGTDGSRWRVTNTETVATLTLTNTTTSSIELTAFHFDVGRWYSSSSGDFTLSISGDVTADPALLVATGLTELGQNGTDFDDFDVVLTGLADHTLDPGESVVFTFDFVSDPACPDCGTFIDNLAVLGDVILPPGLEIVTNGDGTVTLTWNGSGTLQSVDNLGDAWSDVAGNPVSPATLPMTDTREFYRVSE